MIKVVYRGRLGNQLFQYCFGRILAESMGWALNCKPIAGFAGTTLPIFGDSHTRPIVAYLGDAVVNLNAIACDRSPRKIVIKAWLQRYDYYRVHAEHIRRWVAPLESRSGSFPVAGRRDIVLHMRLGRDFEAAKWTLAPDFYYRALESAGKVDKLFICYDSREPISELVWRQCLEPFLRFRPVVFASANPLRDFNFVRQFSRIAIASSTFCWWAAYLSRAEEIFFPNLRCSTTSCWRRRGDPEPFALEVDETRYRYIDAQTLWDRRICQ
jgi:hypothetical protein